MDRRSEIHTDTLINVYILVSVFKWTPQKKYTKTGLNEKREVNSTAAKQKPVHPINTPSTIDSDVFTVHI